MFEIELWPRYAWIARVSAQHRAMTLPQIALRFPGYFFWAVDEGVFEAREHLCAHAKMVARTATRIPIPKEYNAEYLIEFVGLRIVHIPATSHWEYPFISAGLH